MYKAKLNLEKLNYSGLRGSNGTLNSAWDKAFNNVLWQFLSDYGLKGKYNSLPDSEKKINLFIWIQQAVNGQRDKTTASGGNSEGKVDNNNSSNTQVVTISTVNSSFYDGVKEAVNSNKDSLWKMINNPFKTAVDLSKGVSFLAKALNPGTNENTLLAKILYETIQKTSGDFISSNGNARAKMVGRAVGEIVIGLIGAKGLNVALDALKYAANTGKFMGIVNDVKAGKKCDDVYNAIKGVSSANFGSIEKLEGHFTKHRGEFKGIYNTADEYLQGARDVMNNGYKVQYKYKGEIRTGYVRLMENSGKGVAKFEFVGTNNAGEITTYHVESGKDFWKMLNGQNIPEINPID